MANSDEPRFWGHLKIVDIFEEELTRKGPNGLYKTGLLGPITWRIQCDCGYMFEMVRSEFPGRRMMRDCGREECRFRQQREQKQRKQEKPRRMELGRPRKPPSERRMAVNIYTPLTLIDLYEAKAVELNTNRSSLMLKALREWADRNLG